ncbi:DUF6934 family protein [Mucilaginibacter terrae]|uniref:DUF6934 family protein n=1 Tax=Mucilaginibacter terrae TaxID=1955052 RepID=UPI00363C2D4F
MNRPTYKNLQASEDLQTFVFISDGRRGQIKKAVEYTPIDIDNNIYNLGFGTLNEDYSIAGNDRTNNGDINKVLSTVAKTIDVYTHFYPSRKIYFTGYMPQLTKIYNRAISANYHLIDQNYYIYGDNDDREDHYSFEDFVLGKTYYGFLLQRR